MNYVLPARAAPLRTQWTCDQGENLDNHPRGSQRHTVYGGENLVVLLNQIIQNGNIVSYVFLSVHQLTQGPVPVHSVGDPV